MEQKEKINGIIKNFIDSEEGGFVKNQHGVYLYSAGHHSFNLECLLEDFLEYALEDLAERSKA